MGEGGRGIDVFGEAAQRRIARADRCGAKLRTDHGGGASTRAWAICGPGSRRANAEGRSMSCHWKPSGGAALLGAARSRQTRPLRRGVIMLLACMSLCGCFSFGTTRLYEDQLGYSQALGDAEK